MDTDLQPFVSVLTPIYNMGSYLAECIESVLAQTYKNFEYIIVNNCSTDNSMEIALSYAAKDSRIKVLNNDTFVGVIENHNIAFRAISPESKYCKVVSADDWLFPDCLRQMLELAEGNPSVGITGSYYIVGKRIWCTGLEYERKIVSGRQISRETLLGGPYVFGAPTSILYRSDLIRRNNDFYPGSSPHADVTAVYESLKDCDFGFVHQVLSYTRIHPESQTTNSLKLGTNFLSTIGDVIRFGPEYLSVGEQKKRLNELQDAYYGFLAGCIRKQLWNGAFWQRQKAEVQKIGLQFSNARLCKSVLLYLGSLLARPTYVVNKIIAIVRGSDKESKTEGLYY